MAATSMIQAALPAVKLSSSPASSNSTRSSSAFFGTPSRTLTSSPLSVNNGKARITCAIGGNSKKADKWGDNLGTKDFSDDQQDIQRGKGMVDSLFQGFGMGTQEAVLSSYDYISQGQRDLQWDNIKDGYYIAPAFMDKIVVHLAKNFMSLPNIKVPLILGVWGGKGQGKSFQAELIFAKLGISPIVMSAGELESGTAGEPAKLIRQRYREASDIIKKGKMCALFINDLDAGAGRMGGTTQYTVNNQMVNATLMNIADNPTNVQLPGMYNKDEIPRVPVIVTGNDFSTLYAPLIRDGRMEKFYWAPTREDRIGVCQGIFREDKIGADEVTKLVDTFPGQSIDFFGALRARVYDDEVRKWVADVGVENLGKRLINSKEGPPTFAQPTMTLQTLLNYGNMLVAEQDNVKRVQLADTYLEGAALGNANEDDFRRLANTAGSAAQAKPPPVAVGCADPQATNFDPRARSDDGSCSYDWDTIGKKEETKKETKLSARKETAAYDWGTYAAKTPEPKAASAPAPAKSSTPRKEAAPYDWGTSPAKTPEPKSASAPAPVRSIKPSDRKGSKPYDWGTSGVGKNPVVSEPVRSSKPSPPRKEYKAYDWGTSGAGKDPVVSAPAPKKATIKRDVKDYDWGSFSGKASTSASKEPEAPPAPKKASPPRKESAPYDWGSFK